MHRLIKGGGGAQQNHGDNLSCDGFSTFLLQLLSCIVAERLRGQGVILQFVGGGGSKCVKAIRGDTSLSTITAMIWVGTKDGKRKPPGEILFTVKMLCICQNPEQVQGFYIKTTRGRHIIVFRFI